MNVAKHAKGLATNYSHMVPKYVLLKLQKVTDKGRETRSTFELNRNRQISPNSATKGLQRNCKES